MTSSSAGQSPDTPPTIWWSRNQNAVYREYVDAGVIRLREAVSPELQLPSDAVRLVEAGRMEDRWALDDIAELAGFHRDAHPAEVVRAVRAALAARTTQPTDEVALLRTRVAELTEELAQADAFGRGEFRVTSWAFGQARKAQEKYRAQVAAVQALCDQEDRGMEEVADFYRTNGGVKPEMLIGPHRARIHSDAIRQALDAAPQAGEPT